MRLPAILKEAAAVFGTVSVVQMASDNSANDRADGLWCRESSGNRRRILSTASGTPMPPVEQTNNSSGLQVTCLAASATVRSAAACPSAPVAQLALPAFTTTPRIRPFDARRFALETSTGAATTRFCVNTAAADAGTSLEKIARSSAPVFFRPQAVAANRNPRGSDASERACFMSAVLRSSLLAAVLCLFLEAMILRICEPISAWPGPDATALPLPFRLEPFFEVLASDPRKRPPILREVRECLLFEIDDLGAHGFSPVLELSLAFSSVMRFCNSAIAERTCSGAVPPGTALVAMELSTEGAARKSCSKSGEIFCTSSRESCVQGLPWRSASRSTLPIRSWAWRKGSPLWTR